MKKSVSFLGILLMLSSNAALFAQMPVAVAPVVAPSGMEQIGIVAAAKGKVELTMPGQVGRIAQSGQPVFMREEIKTDEQGNLQILLLDETVFTIGPNSTLVIDEFVYDPKTQNGKVQASIAKGVFRYVSGKIAAKKPSNVTLKLPAATIGIRGTIVGGSVVPGGQSLAALLGPGANNNAGAHPGGFFITGPSGNQDVNHTGFGVIVGPDGSISGVFQLSQADITKLTTGLSPSGGGSHSGQGGGSATNQSGQGNVMTGENSDVAGGLSSLSDTNNETSTTAAQYSSSVANGITNIQDLSAITQGEYTYVGTGGFGTTGSTIFVCDINFGAKTIGGAGYSYVEVIESSKADVAALSAQSYASMTGNAVFHWTNIAGEVYGTFKNVDMTLSNSGGVVANQATMNVSYQHGGESGPSDGTGNATGPRIPTPPMG
jgi:hypothetical protein